MESVMYKSNRVYAKSFIVSDLLNRTLPSIRKVGAVPAPLNTRAFGTSTSRAIGFASQSGSGRAFTTPVVVPTKEPRLEIVKRAGGINSALADIPTKSGTLRVSPIGSYTSSIFPNSMLKKGNAESILNATAGAATGVAAYLAGKDDEKETTMSDNPTTELIDTLKSMSSDKTGSSIEFLAKPLNAVILGWLQSNAPMVNDLFAITGKQPTDVIDSIISTFRARKTPPSVSEVDSIMRSIMETSREQVALKADQYEYKPGYESKVNDTLGSRDQWETMATGVAILEHVHSVVPGGIRTVIALREALYMEPEFFDLICERTFGFAPQTYYASVVDSMQARVSMGVR